MFDINTSLGFLLAKCHQKAFHRLKGRLEPYNITPPQFATLAFLWKEHGISQNTLGELMEVDRTTIGGILGRLEKVGLVWRETNPADRRAALVYITEKARELRPELEAIAIGHNNWLARQFSNEELEVLKSQLKKMRFENNNISGGEN